MEASMRPAVTALTDIVYALHASGAYDDFRHPKSGRFRLWVGLHHSTQPMHFLDIEMRGARMTSDARRCEMVSLVTQTMLELGFTHLGAANPYPGETVIWCPSSIEPPVRSQHERLNRYALIRDILIRQGAQLDEMAQNQDALTGSGLLV